MCRIAERVLPRLAHANAAVVLSAVKVTIKLLELLEPDSDFFASVQKKLAPPLVTLLSAEPEIQYVALRFTLFPFSFATVQRSSY